MAAKKTIKGKKKAADKFSAKDKNPEYMVQVNEPKILRKDLLECLREVIMFMQSYEKFRKIQEDKVAVFSQLKADVRELNAMFDTLKSHLPKGKLRGLPITMPEMEKPRVQEQKEIPVQEVPVVREERPVFKTYPKAVPEEKSELDELEDQLKDIEGQLRNIK